MIDHDILQATLDHAVRTAAISPRCSWKIAARRAAASTTAGSRSSCRDAIAAPGCVSCAATPPGSRTPPTCRATASCKRPTRPRRPRAAAEAAPAPSRWAPTVPASRPRSRAARDGGKAAQGRDPCPRRRGGARRGPRDHVGHRVVRRRAPAHPRRQLRRSARRRRPRAYAHGRAGGRDRRHGHADRATKRRAARWASSSSTSSGPKTSGAPRRTRALTLLDAVPAPSGRFPVVLQARRRRRAVPRGVRARPRSRSHSRRTRRCSKATWASTSRRRS